MVIEQPTGRLLSSQRGHAVYSISGELELISCRGVLQGFRKVNMKVFQRFCKCWILDFRIQGFRNFDFQGFSWSLRAGGCLWSNALPDQHLGDIRPSCDQDCVPPGWLLAQALLTAGVCRSLLNRKAQNSKKGRRTTTATKSLSWLT